MKTHKINLTLIYHKNLWLVNSYFLDSKGQIFEDRYKHMQLNCMKIENCSSKPLQITYIFQLIRITDRITLDIYHSNPRHSEVFLVFSWSTIQIWRIWLLMIALICIYTLHVKIPSNVYLCLYILSKSGLQRPGIYNAGVLTCIFIYSWNILVPKIWTLLSPTVLKLINVLDWLYNTLVVYPTCNYLKRIQ